MGAQDPPEHVPLQQLLLAVQVRPLSTHVWVEQRPFSQRLLQHSLLLAHPVPEAPHWTERNWQVLPAAALHEPSQHVLPTQEVPIAAQVLPPAWQVPEMHDVPVQHVWPRAHDPPSPTQTPPEVWQVQPAAELHTVPAQHVSPVAHDRPGCWHAPLVGWQMLFALHVSPAVHICPEQHGAP
jgi:hypothetical protein